jgi:hypothetical protein
MTDQPTSLQVYSNDDQPNDHVFEEGRQLATESNECVYSDRTTGGYTGYPRPSHGQHQTL